MPRPAADVRRLASVAAALALAACSPDAEVVAPPDGEAAAIARTGGAVDLADRIVYTASAGPSANRAMSVRPDGSGARPLLGAAQRWTWIVGLTFSPKRDRVLFQGDGAVHVLHRDGATVEIGHDSLNVNEPRWSPDGRWVVGTQFWPAVGDRRGTVWLMAADGGGATRLTVGTTDYARFTPDGLIAVQGDPGRGEGWEHVGLDGAVVRRVGALDQIALRQRLEDTSPDGRWRAAVSPRRGIFLIDAASGDSLRILDRAGVSYRVRWSPDGRALAALAGCGASGLDAGELLVVAADGSGARTVARNVFCRGGFDW